jgi:hypothetical protein
MRGAAANNNEMYINLKKERMGFSRTKEKDEFNQSKNQKDHEQD